MLYDKRWDKHLKVDPFTLTGLIAWLETKNPSEVYRYEHSGRCLLAQYFTAKGYQNVEVDPEGYFHHGAVFARFKIYPKEFDKIACACPRTFGGALERARAMAARS